VPLLEKALDLRRRIAAMLGYDTWADYVTEVKMVKSGKNAQDVSNLITPVKLTYMRPNS